MLQSSSHTVRLLLSSPPQRKSPALEIEKIDISTPRPHLPAYSA